MHQSIVFIQWVIFIYLAVQVFYLLFFSVAGKLAKKKDLLPAKQLRRIRVFIPGYKEDAVIIETAKVAFNHDYPKDKFEVVVIADSFAPHTLSTLHTIGVKVLEVSFEKSTKGKALHKAIESTINDPADIAVILDADNHMSPGFLHKVNNAFEAGYEVVQGHRTAKNLQTSFAYLDACIEEVNNHIFRRGHTAIGLPSALIGSGMAFNWNLFVNLLEGIGDTAGEDKELEFRILRQGKKICFLDEAYVYDEKVAQSDVFSKQRSRWLAMQFEYFKKYFFEGWKLLAKGNLAFFDKVFQTYLLPRVMLIGMLGASLIGAAFASSAWFIGYGVLIGAWAVALLLGIPAKWYNRQLLAAFIQIPNGFFSMVKATLNMGRARFTFVHTPHGVTSSQVMHTTHIVTTAHKKAS